MKEHRRTDIEISREDFKQIGYRLIDQLAEFTNTMGDRPVTKGETAEELQDILGKEGLPENGRSASIIMEEVSSLLLEHSLFNGHPKFMGYITSSPAPIGMLADLLAAGVNQNAGAQILSPLATEIEKQTIRWLAEFIGVENDYGGILVSGGNMANFTAFLAARTAKAPKSIKEKGLVSHSRKMISYCSKSTHTWIEKAVILFGHGSDSIRWIETDSENKMNNDLLEKAVQNDFSKGHHPFMVVGTAGDVSTGVVDKLDAIAAIAKKHDLWFHIDGAYGIPAAVIPELKNLFHGIREADSLALDPHKWLYSPLEAGCTLVKNRKHLTDTFSSHPEYYNFSKDTAATQNFYEYGLQNSRGFRALKVWMALKQVGRRGYEKMIKEDIDLSRTLYELVDHHDELEAISQHLSIATFRYVPLDLKLKSAARDSYLNELNESLVDVLQQGGEAFLSNAVVDKNYLLRACIVNFRTTKNDIEEIIEIVVREGAKIHTELQAKINKK